MKYDSSGHPIKQEVSETEAQTTDIETLMEIAITNKAAGEREEKGRRRVGEEGRREGREGVQREGGEGEGREERGPNYRHRDTHGDSYH